MSLNVMDPPLPAGWGAFCSQPDPHRKSVLGHWYANAPYLAYKVPGQKPGACLAQTVYADTYEELYGLVAEEAQLHARLTGVKAP
ncbi:hypothetical protein ACFW81_02460 [Streptomyces angustmyceticus]|uniref:hypothetical protein n=1 Tax=Streptomyces angustmyceticus TaxID=285578 RepID=UPI00368E14AE